jgi:hypothetical protein
MMMIPTSFPGNVESCDGQDNDCDMIIDEAEDACPLTPNVDSTFCGPDSSCAIYSCAEGYFDLNGIYADGCESECPADEYEANDNCADAYDLDFLVDTPATQLLITGNIVPESEDDWFEFDAIDNQSEVTESFNVRIEFTTNPNSKFQIEVYRGGCPGIGTLGDGDIVNDYLFIDYGDPSQDDSATYYVRVYKDPQTTFACDGFTLRIYVGPDV